MRRIKDDEEENKKEVVAAGPKDPVKLEDGEEVVGENKGSNVPFYPYKNAFKKVKDIRKNFVFQKELGSGAFGTVFLAVH